MGKVRYLAFLVICSLLMINEVSAENPYYDFKVSYNLGLGNTMNFGTGKGTVTDVLSTEDGYIVLYRGSNKIGTYDKNGNELSLEDTEFRISKIIEIDNQYYVIANNEYKDNKIYMNVFKLDLDGKMSEFQKINMDSFYNLKVDDFYKVNGDYIYFFLTHIDYSGEYIKIKKDFSSAEVLSYEEMTDDEKTTFSDIYYAYENGTLIGTYNDGVVYFSDEENKITYYKDGVEKWNFVDSSIISPKVHITTYKNNLLVALVTKTGEDVSNKIITISQDGEVLDEMDITSYYSTIFLDDYVEKVVLESYPIIALDNGFLISGLYVGNFEDNPPTSPINEANLKIESPPCFYFGLYFTDYKPEVEDEKVPETLDNVYSYVIMLAISGLTLGALGYKKRYN